jgi:predicted nucleic acid-binding protein
VILVDTAVWIDHLRHGDPVLGDLLERGQVLAHPWVIGELALGHLHNRGEFLQLLGDLPTATMATAAEMLAFIERHELFGVGIGYVDAQLLAATKLTEDARLWTRDRRLGAVSERLGVIYNERDGQVTRRAPG